MRARLLTATTLVGAVLLTSCGDSDDSRTLPNDDPVVKALNACNERIEQGGDRRADGDAQTDSRTPNKWIISGQYTVVSTEQKYDYTCTVTKTPGYDELRVDVPLRD